MVYRVFQTLLNTILILLFLMAAVSQNGRLFGKKTEWYFEERSVEKEEVLVDAPSVEQLKNFGFVDIRLDSETNGVWTINRSNQTYYIVNSSVFSEAIYGFGGPVPMLLLLDNQKNILAVQSLKNNETPSFWQSVVDAGIIEQWNGKAASSLSTFVPDAVTGATLSSNAVNQSIALSLAAVDNVQASVNNSSHFGYKSLSALLVIAFGVFVSFTKRFKKNLRLALLILNVSVLGIWCGKFISMQVLMGFAANGVNLVSGGIVLLMVLLSILMPLFFKKKSYYCNFICPYGAAQELAGKIRKRKYHPKGKVAKFLKHSQLAITLALFVMMWLGIATNIVDYEPFSAFLFSVASPIVLIIAGLGILAAIFTPRPWCKFVCPTGQVLNWTNKM